MTQREIPDKLNRREQKILLDLARKAIETQLSGMPITFTSISDKALTRQLGVFVTLHKHGQLRGCIGTFVSNKPLYEQVCDMAISSAFNDPRFRPLAKAELKDITLEISVLSPLRRITDINEIEVGVHGIYIIKGPHGGVLLPQVATEYGWDRLTFLDQTCVKAGLYPGCWKDHAAEIYIFSADIFNEETEEIGP
ncbi:MAG: AmmeMemoRadiSam system protein A [Desulfobacteraceae bacterium]|nr:AmmeMemoRadiSam system protein A [Desulfobacteraceae bacterium]